jgi:helix-hairpin-helix protein
MSSWLTARRIAKAEHLPAADDLAFAQPTQPQMFGYKRAASAILALEQPLTSILDRDGGLPKIAGIGPGSARVIAEVLECGGSPTVERAIDVSGRRTDIERRRTLREHFLSRAEVLRILSDSSLDGPSMADYGGDLQMHSEWSDGYPTVIEISQACQARGYAFAAVTDHSHGLKIAGGMSMQGYSSRAHRELLAARSTLVLAVASPRGFAPMSRTIALRYRSVSGTRRGQP